MSKPRVTVNCVANKYAAPNERIIEVFDKDTKQGALISLLSYNGRLIIGLYCADHRVEIRGQS